MIIDSLIHELFLNSPEFLQCYRMEKPKLPEPLFKVGYEPEMRRANGVPQAGIYGCHKCCS